MQDISKSDINYEGLHEYSVFCRAAMGRHSLTHFNLPCFIDMLTGMRD